MGGKGWRGGGVVFDSCSSTESIRDTTQDHRRKRCRKPVRIEWRQSLGQNVCDLSSFFHPRGTDGRCKTFRFDLRLSLIFFFGVANIVVVHFSSQRIKQVKMSVDQASPRDMSKSILARMPAELRVSILEFEPFLSKCDRCGEYDQTSKVTCGKYPRYKIVCEECEDALDRTARCERDYASVWPTECTCRTTRRQKRRRCTCGYAHTLHMSELLRGQQPLRVTSFG